jgi:hypothetical protein
MQKHYDDATGQELDTSKRHYQIDLPVHLLKAPGKELSGHVRFEEGKPEGISGRSVGVDLSLTNYNRIMGAAVAELHKIQTENGVPLTYWPEAKDK